MLGLAFAQNDSIQSIKADSFNIVDIKLNGTIVLENSFDNTVHIRTDSRVDGKVIGFSNRNEIPAYTVDSKISDHTLYISAHPRKKSWTIGISTLVEENTHYIHVPQNMNISVYSNNAKIIINGLFSLLKTENDKGETHIRLNKSQLHYLRATSDNGEIIINNTAKPADYSLISAGESIVDVSSRSGSITIDVQ